MDFESDLLLLPLVIVPLILIIIAAFYILGVSTRVNPSQCEQPGDQTLKSRTKSLKHSSVVLAMTR